MTLLISHSFHMDRVHWVLEACCLLVPATAQARQMHIRLIALCPTLYVGAPSPFSTLLTRCRHFMIGARGPHPLLILLEACHLRHPMSHRLCMQVPLHCSECHQFDTTILRLELGATPPSYSTGGMSPASLRYSPSPPNAYLPTSPHVPVIVCGCYLTIGYITDAMLPFYDQSQGATSPTYFAGGMSPTLPYVPQSLYAGATSPFGTSPM